jgi:MFS transporter, ACS family, glucarate transporter
MKELRANQPAAAKTGLRSSVRYQVLWMSVLLYAITYMDRVCIAAAAPVIKREFGFDNWTMGLVFSLFGWGYGLFQVPAGWLVDRIGPRRMLSAIVIWWSAFTVLTGFAWNAASLMVIRFLFGVGQAGAFPSATRAFSRWLAASERGFAQGITHSGSRLAGSLTPAATVALMSVWGWRGAFVFFGGAGIVWAILWFFWYRDRPEDHPGVSQLELESIHAGRAPVFSVAPLAWRKLLGSANTWCLCVMYFCYGYVLWIFLNWLPTYFTEVRHFSLLKASFYAGAPLLAGTITNTLGGWLSDHLYKRTGNLRSSRRIIAVAGFGIAVAFVALGILAASPTTAIVFMSIAVAGLELTTGVSWAVPLDIGRDHAGKVSGLMNTFGNVGGALSPIVFAWMLQAFESWTPGFLLGSALCLVAALLWLKIDPTRPVEGVEIR